MFRHFDKARFPSSTLDALALVNRAYRSNPHVGELVSFALRDALFEKGEDISDSSTLEQIADSLGVPQPDESDPTGVLADWHEGERRGVLGSPHFFCGDANAFCPSLKISRDPVNGMSIIRDSSCLADFLAEMFSPDAGRDRPRRERGARAWTRRDLLP